MKRQSFFQFSLLLLVAVFLFSSCKKDNDVVYPELRDYDFQEPVFNGNTFYIDPVNGSMDGNGSAENPWRTLQEVIENNLIEHYRPSVNYNPESELIVVNSGAPVKGGDKLVLLDGYHGFIGINTFIFNDWLTIEAKDGHHPVLSQFKIEGAFKNIYLKNLSIIKESYQGTENYWQATDINYNSDACLHLASSDFWGKGSDIKLYGLTLKTAENTISWTAQDWIDKSAAGISLRSVKNVEIFNCTIENIDFGMAIEYFSDNTTAMYNTINNYSCDGCRIISNNVLFAYNTIKGCLAIDDNHDDAIQSYTRGEDDSPGTGTLYNVTIRGNLIIGITDLNNPLAGQPQGIGCFDGIFDNWTVENNVIIVDHYHGISFYGMRNGKIINNTVIDQNPGNETSPWIMVTNHKDGTPSENCIVANNIVYRSISAEGYNVTQQNNYIIGDANNSQIYDLFSDPDHFDMHLLNNELTSANIIDQGIVNNGTVSSEIDKDKNTRSLLPDLGAYEAD
jgi:hypothetical protein